MLESYKQFERTMRRRGNLLAAGLLVYFLALCVAAGSAWSSHDRIIEKPDRGVGANLSLTQTTYLASPP